MVTLRRLLKKWIIDPFAVTNLPQLPSHGAEEFLHTWLKQQTGLLLCRSKKIAQMF